jgi:hypothetical protein
LPSRWSVHKLQKKSMVRKLAHGYLTQKETPCQPPQ